MLEEFCLHMVSGLCRVVELALATLSSVCMVGMSLKKQTMKFEENGEHQQYHDTWHMTHDSASGVLPLCLRGNFMHVPKMFQEGFRFIPGEFQFVFVKFYTCVSGFKVFRFHGYVSRVL